MGGDLGPKLWWGEGSTCWGGISPCPVLTVVGDIGDLEASGAVGFTGLEVDPELAGAGGEGDGPLIGLAGLVGGDGGWGGCREQQGDTGCWLPISRATPSLG